MSPTLIWLIVFAAVLVSGTVLGGLAIFGGTKMAGGVISMPKALGAGFTATLVATGAYELLITFIDKPAQPLMGPAFFAAAALALALSYVIVMKFSEVEPGKVPLVWSGYALVLVASLAAGRIKGWDLREDYGFYRGYETVWAL